MCTLQNETNFQFFNMKKNVGMSWVGPIGFSYLHNWAGPIPVPFFWLHPGPDLGAWWGTTICIKLQLIFIVRHQYFKRYIKDYLMMVFINYFNELMLSNLINLGSKFCNFDQSVAKVSFFNGESYCSMLLALLSAALL